MVPARGAVRKVNRPGLLLVTYFVPAHNLEQGDKAVLPKKRKGVITLAEEITGMACGLYEGLSPLPKDPVPGMAYVPYQKWDAQLHSLDRALDAGTLFPILDKPFYGRRGEPR